jgi:NhaP-type Na+/H+ or K+/H+ antiporter
MLEIFLIILMLILISKFIEDSTRMPFVLVVIILSYTANHFFDLSILGENFESIMYLMLPIILIPDVLGLSRSEIQENFSNIFYLAVTAVIISITLAVGITYLIDDKYNFSIFHLLILFTPLMATDVVSVGAIFSKFKLPEQLKLFAEGESLFNDITAMLIFFFIAIPMLNGENLSISSLSGIVAYTVVLSIVIGVIVGLAGYYSFKISKDSFEEFISIYVMGSLAFLISDKIHLSGILSVVVSVLFFKYLFDKEGHYKTIKFVTVLKHFNTQSSSEISFRAYKKEAHYLGLFANAVIFISIANVINLELLWNYKLEILYAFLLTTIIRYFVILIFIKYRKLSLRWSNILTLSGMKGGLALIMIVSLSDQFAYKEMFIAIVLGVVILSIFVYTLLLMAYLLFEKENMLMDNAIEHKINFKDMKELMEKEQNTGAYNEVVFDDFIDKEIVGAQRYNYQFSLVAFNTDTESLHIINKKLIRQSDYFGKIDEDMYAVLLSHCSINDALVFINKLKPYMHHEHIAVAEYMPGDSKEIVLEKLQKALKDKKEVDIEI